VWRPVIERCLRLIDARYDHVRLGHGRARCVDTWASAIGQGLGWTINPYPVLDRQWRDLGRAAGPARNRFMLDVERPHLVLGFMCRGSSPGTFHCLRTAVQRHIPIVKITYEDLLIWQPVATDLIAV
jgi:hypothetical protein